jgi:glycosyltransferase involved in cell wall biosynthesis
MSPLEHYLKHGKRLSPHPLFDPEYYLAHSPNAVSASVSLLEHYLANWKTERSNPHPLLDVDAYLECYPDVVPSGLDPLSHFIVTGAAAGYNPHPLFDTSFYHRQYPDVKAAGINPLVHYAGTGGFEGRDPNPWFDSRYYLECNPDVARARINPLVHYVLAGAREGRAPHPLFRNRHWRSVQGLSSDGPEVLANFLAYADRPAVNPIAALQLRGRRRCVPEGVEGLPGVNLIGWPRMEMGVAEQMREVARCLVVAGIDVSAKDVSNMTPTDPGDDSLVHRIRPDCPHRVNIFVINADNMTEVCQGLEYEDLALRFNVASWSWELADFPDAWESAFAVVDELWVYSTFMQRAISLKADVPVLYMPPAVTLPRSADLDRADFGIPHDGFVFLFLFDFAAFIARKNPYAALAAFRRAFPSVSADATLVIKTNNASRYPEALRELQEAVAGDPRIVLIHDTLRRDRVVSLLSHADVFVSLHRAEGFGRSLAESMLLGKPVIATNYSGNTDFMSASNSCPVNYSLIPVRPGEYPFWENQVWADPDIEQAAWYMRRLERDRGYREWIGAAAKDTMVRDFSPEATGLRCLRRLQALGLE